MNLDPIGLHLMLCVGENYLSRLSHVSSFQDRHCLAIPDKFILFKFCDLMHVAVRIQLPNEARDI